MQWAVLFCEQVNLWARVYEFISLRVHAQRKAHSLNHSLEFSWSGCSFSHTAFSTSYMQDCLIDCTHVHKYFQSHSFSQSHRVVDIRAQSFTHSQDESYYKSSARWKQHQSFRQSQDDTYCDIIRSWGNPAVKSLWPHICRHVNMSTCGRSIILSWNHAIASSCVTKYFLSSM